MIDPIGALRVVDAFRNIDSVLKIFDFRDNISDPEIQRLIKQRDNARMKKDWALADKIRDQLTARGITIKDERATEKK
jgi:cysteinyl-tRNA synthetase